MTKYEIQLGGTIATTIGFLDLLIFFAFLNIQAAGAPIYLVTVAQFLFAIGWTVLAGFLIFVALIVVLIILAAVAA